MPIWKILIALIQAFTYMVVLTLKDKLRHHKWEGKKMFIGGKTTMATREQKKMYSAYVE